MQNEEQRNRFYIDTHQHHDLALLDVTQIWFNGERTRISGLELGWAGVGAPDPGVGWVVGVGGMGVRSEAGFLSCEEVVEKKGFGLDKLVGSRACSEVRLFLL